MNIIILPSGRKKSRGLCFSLLPGVVAATFVLATVVGTTFIAVQQYQRLVDGELQELRSVKADAEASLEVMAGRLGLLQSHVLRLDALGARLAGMMEADGVAEFDFENPPGVGGPAAAAALPRLSDEALLASFARLERTLQDRDDQLTAMESLLLNRSLRDQTQPLGHPARGGWISSLFGRRTDPISGRREFHQGIDLAGRIGLPVTAVAAGIVTWSGPNQGYGNMVEIDHGNRYLTRYAHNSKNLVSIGDRVEKGEAIALMGNSGRSTGPHVHFEVVRNGEHVDPRRYISSQ